MNYKALLFVCFSLYMMYRMYRVTIPKDKVAKPGQESMYGKYENISTMKHDFFKLFIFTFMPLILIDNNMPFFTVDNFEQSIVGKSLLVGFIAAFFHTVVEPLINNLPAF